VKKILFFLCSYIIILNLSLYAKSEQKIYLLPKERYIALKTLLKNIDLAKSEIKISIYTFTNKKIAKRLKNAAKRGVKIEIIFDDGQSRKKDTRSMLYYLSKYKNIKTYRLKPISKHKRRYSPIMHIKMALIDKKISIFGSANWTNMAFSKNYETLFITKDYQVAKKFLNFFKEQKKSAKLYK